MSVVDKKYGLNLQAKCRTCGKLLCCIEHRVVHEKFFHPEELKNVLTDISNNREHHNGSLGSIKITNMRSNQEAIKSLRAVKIIHSPGCTRKRKRDALATASPIQKRKRSLPNHVMNTPNESPKSPLALFNNGLKNDSSVFATAENTPIKTSSPIFSHDMESNPFNASSNTSKYTTINLDDCRKDVCGTEEHIGMRAPIREYTTTLEMSRQLLKPVEGRAPYYVPNTVLQGTPPSYKVRVSHSLKGLQSI